MTATTAPPEAGQYIPPTGDLYDSAMVRERLAGAQEVRADFSAHMRRVEAGEEYVVVLRRSKVAGVFIPKRWFRRMQELGITDEPATDDEED